MNLKRHLKLFVVTGICAGTGFALLANGAIVLNGSDSLPHNAYYMLKAPLIVARGTYVAFDPPAIVAEKFEELTFVKRVVGRPGDLVVTENNQVCVGAECRDLHEDALSAGYLPLESGIIPDNEYVVFGDSPDSLDSRYRAIGTIKRAKITAAGLPLAFPHWKKVQQWLGG